MRPQMALPNNGQRHDGHIRYDKSSSQTASSRQYVKPSLASGFLMGGKVHSLFWRVVNGNTPEKYGSATSIVGS